jgi:hypothetical protein
VDKIFNKKYKRPSLHSAYKIIVPYIQEGVLKAYLNLQKASIKHRWIFLDPENNRNRKISTDGKFDTCLKQTELRECGTQIRACVQ